MKDIKTINLGASGSRDLCLLMHVAVQAARKSVETLGDELDETDLVLGLEYPAFSYMHLGEQATAGTSAAQRAQRSQELMQAAHFLAAFGLAELLTVKQGFYIRLLPHVNDFNEYLT